MTLRDQFIETGLFIETDCRDLVFEVPHEEGENIRVRFEFDSFGDLVNMQAHIVCVAMRAMVAANRRALGLPPQHSAGAGHL